MTDAVYTSDAASAIEERWKSPDLWKNGRPSRKQNKIDIYGAPDDIGLAVLNDDLLRFVLTESLGSPDYIWGVLS
jgi:hypothetical protein